MSIFAAKNSGMASMLQSIIPAEIMQSINGVAEKLPLFMAEAEKRIKAIESAQQEINRKLDLLLEKAGA